MEERRTNLDDCYGCIVNKNTCDVFFGAYGKLICICNVRPFGTSDNRGHDLRWYAYSGRDVQGRR